MSNDKKPLKRKLSYDESMKGDKWSEWYKPKNNVKLCTQRAIYEELDQIMGSWYYDENKAMHYKCQAFKHRIEHLIREKRILDAHVEAMQEAHDAMLERLRHERSRIQLFADLIMGLYESSEEARDYLQRLGIMDIDQQGRTITIEDTVYDLEEF